MALDDLVIRASIRDEMSRPLRHITDELAKLRREATRAAAENERLAVAATKASQNMDRAGRSGQMFSGVLRAIGNAALFTAGTLGVAATAGTVMGLKTAAGLEQAHIGFTTLMGSAAEATSYMSELKTLALNTPFGLPDLTQGAQRLQAMGMTAAKAKETLIAAGNAAAAIGSGREGVERMTLAFAQMQSTGRVMGEEVRQLNQAGVDAFGILAQAAGKSVVEIRKMSEAGLLDAQTHIPILVEGINKRLGNAMANQMNTLQGLWMRLTESFQMGLADAIKPSEATIKQFMRDLITAVGPFSKGLAEAGVAFLPAMQALSKALVPLTPVLTEIAVVLGKGIADVILALTPSLPALAEAFRDVLKALAPLATELATSLADAIIQIAPDLPEIAQALVDIAQAALVLTPLIIGIADAIAGLAQYEGVVWALVAVWAAYKVNLMVASGWITITTGGLWANTAAAWANNTAMFTTARTWLGMRLAAIVLTASIWGATVAQWASTAATWAWATASWVLAGAWAFLTAPITLTVLAIVAAIAALAAIAYGLYWAYQNVEWFRNAVDATWNALKTMGVWIWDTSKAVGEFISAFFKGDWDGMSGALGKLGDKFKYVGEWAQKAWNWVKSWFTSGEEVAPTPAPAGDTATSRMGGGGLDRTLGMHAQLMAGTSGKIGISNALMGGGGMGRGSGDHQAGRALDLVGSGLNAYATQLRALGGYAAFHGSGAGRHLHAVYPSGDTATSRARPPFAGGGGVAMRRETIVIQPGAITVHAGPGVDAEGQVRRALERFTRDRAERV